MLQDTNQEHQEETTHKGNGKGRPKAKRKATGQKDDGTQPAVQRPQVIGERIEELVTLHINAKQATNAAAEAITKAAEDSGYLASAVKKLVVARAGDKFEEKHREVEQQAELFDEVGE